MSNINSDPLISLTVQLKKQYEELDQIVNSLNARPVDCTDAISEQLKQIKRTEAQLLPLREEFRGSHAQLPPSLQEPMDATIDLVKGLMPKLAQLEKATLDSAQKLFPKIQESVRAVQMQNAYRAGRAS